MYDCKEKIRDNGSIPKISYQFLPIDLSLRSAYVTQFSIHLHIRDAQCNVGYMWVKYSLESLRSTTRPAQQRGLNFSSRMSAKQFYCCNKCLKIFQITLQTAKFD